MNNLVQRPFLGGSVVLASLQSNFCQRHFPKESIRTCRFAHRFSLLFPPKVWFAITTFLLLLSFACFVEVGRAQAPAWIWAKSAGGVGTDIGPSIAVDGAGNSYVTGYFTSPSITFGSTTLTSSGSYDIFVVKYDANGNALWAKSAGGSMHDYAYGIAVDGAGNSYVTGTFQSPSITFGSTTLTNNGWFDMFVVKYDADGNVVWAKSAGGSTDDIAYSVAVDGAGNSYVTGYFSYSSITFGSTTLTNSGGADLFVVKYDANGDVVWAKSAGGSSYDEGQSIAVDGAGNSYVTGTFQSPSITFGSTTLTNSGWLDMFVVKYDVNGNVVWAKSAGGSNNDEGQSIAVDGAGNSYVTGNFNSSSIIFGSTTLTNSGGFDIFAVKYDANGDVVWAQSAEGSSEDYVSIIAVDGVGNSYVTGYFYSPSITFGSTTLTNSGGYDMFAVKCDANGNGVWAKSAGGSGCDEGGSIAVDGTGNSYVTGFFNSSSITFGSTTLTNSGQNDLFVAKLGHAKQLTLTSPNGGETWKIGTTHPITWTSNGVSYVNLKYSVDNGSNWTVIASSVDATLGSYPWPIPDEPTTQALVQIIDAGDISTFDVSDAVFTISQSFSSQVSGTNKHLNDVSFVNTTTGWAVGDGSTIVKTTNGGVSWGDETNNPNVPSNKQWTGVSFVDANTGWVVGISGSNGLILKTTDGGQTWPSNLQLSITGIKPNDVSFSDPTHGWLVGNNGTIFYTVNGGGNWTEVLPHPTTEHLNGVSIVKGTTYVGYAVGENGTVLKTTNGIAWTPLSTGTSNHLNDMSFVDINHGWVVGNNGTILVTTNGGATWSTQTSGTSAQLNGVSFVNLTLGWAVGNGGTILRYDLSLLSRTRKASASPGGNWTLVPVGTSDDLDAIVLIGGSVGFVIGDSGTVLSYSPPAADSLTSTISVSLNERWNLVSVPSAVSNNCAAVLYPNLISDAFAYVADSGYQVCESLQVGKGYWMKFPYTQNANIVGTSLNQDTVTVSKGWNLIGSISVPVAVTSIISDQGGIVTSQFFGYERRYITRDSIQPGKGYWVKVNQNGKLILASSPSMVSASSHINIVPSEELPPAAPDGKEAASAMPTTYALEQNYPNPFNPTTTLKYSLPTDSRVKLNIYNVLGQVVQTLVDGMESAGYKSAVWNASSVGSGIYFYRFEASSTSDPTKSFTQVKKMLMLK